MRLRLSSIAMQVAARIESALFWAGVLGLCGFIAAGDRNLWAQAPVVSPDGLPVGNNSSGLMQLPPNSPNNPQNFNPTIGSPVAPVQAQRPAGWPGGPGADAVPAPTRKAYAQPFGAPAAGGAPGGTPSANPRNPALLANSAASQSPATRMQLKSPEQTVFEGAEIIAWVGSLPILSADVLYETNKMMEKVLAQNVGREIPPEAMAQGRIMFMKQNLKRVIETKLLYLEASRNVPAEAVPKIEKQFNETFDKMYLHKMMESEGCGSRGELEAKLRRQGTTTDGIRRQAFEGSFAARWLDDHVKDDDEITHEDIRTFYRQHFSEYEKPRRLRWEHVMVRFDKFGSKAEAFGAIAQYGNQILGGASLADIAKAHSQDPSADDGGVHPWTNENSLRSVILDKALFDLPVDKLSQIIEDDRGFHIVRVIERDDTTCRAFVDVQAEIRKKIRSERNSDRRGEYLEKLRAKTPVWTIFDDPDATRTAKGAGPARG